MQKPIYLDYAATTPVAESVAEAMSKCLTREGNFGNPASRSHLYGWKAEEAVEGARSQVAGLINADTREIVWTSGATESNNLAIKAVAKSAIAKGSAHVITCLAEHKAVLDTCEALESFGVDVTYLKPQSGGQVSPSDVKAALRSDTCLVSIMHVNNETGVINDIREIGAICRAAGVFFHVDAAQSACRLALDMSALHVDLLSLSAHKMYGPKGVGALYVRRCPELKVSAEIHGGGHERGMRSGTLPTHQIVGFGQAAELVVEKRDGDKLHQESLKKRFLAGLAGIKAIHIHGGLDNSVPGIINLSFAHVEGEALLLSLSGLAISTGSACTSASLEPSYVLKAMGVEDSLAHGALRFSFGRYTSEDEIDRALELLHKAVAALRESSPEWAAFKAANID